MLLAFVFLHEEFTIRSAMGACLLRRDTCDGFVEILGLRVTEDLKGIIRLRDNPCQML